MRGLKPSSRPLLTALNVIVALCLTLGAWPLLAQEQATGPTAITDKEHQALRYLCDLRAEDALVELASALDRLKNELADKKCDYEELVVKLNEAQRSAVLTYLVGPYYGWTGTHTGCAVRLRIVGDEVCACSLRGNLPDGRPDARRIYKLNLKTLQLLPPVTGPCQGDNYGDEEVADCSTGSVLGLKGCAIGKPPTKKCKQIIQEMDAGGPQR